MDLSEGDLIAIHQGIYVQDPTLNCLLEQIKTALIAQLFQPGRELLLSFHPHNSGRAGQTTGFQIPRWRHLGGKIPHGLIVEGSHKARLG